MGIQPFQRCEHQSAFVIETGRTYDMFKDRSFTKVKVRLTSEICEWIYREMNEGELVYPNEGKGNCQDIADNISNSFIHTEEAFNGAIRWLRIGETEASHYRYQLEKKVILFLIAYSGVRQRDNKNWKISALILQKISSPLSD